MTEYQKLQFGNDAQTVENCNFSLKSHLRTTPSPQGKFQETIWLAIKYYFYGIDITVDLVDSWN